MGSGPWEFRGDTTGTTVGSCGQEFCAVDEAASQGPREAQLEVGRKWERRR